MKRILFNATHAEELRVAVVDGQKLLDLDIESAVRAQKKGNIYKCVVTRVEPSLEAAFVNYGADRHGFLPFKEIYRGYFQNYSSRTPLSAVNIKDVIKEGQELIVQVEKDERSNKGATLTTFISLAGRFLVLMPNNPKGGGISRRVEGQQRNDLKHALDLLTIPPEHAVIARTAALSRTKEELKWDFEFLLQLWEAIEDAATKCKAPTLIYQENNLIVRTIRDYLNASIQELVIDDKEIYERAHRFAQQVMPQNIKKIKHYSDPTPLYSHYQIESQIASAFSREVHLPSGGSIVIDHTEALIAVDVNSARATKGGDIEETALQTNLEAVEEIARQLRVRDIGGLVVLDLIDMGPNENQRTVENRLKDSLVHDRARVRIGQISRFGLLEMSRQRIRSSIGDANYHTCPRCEGTGHIRSIVSNSLNLLRLIEEAALKENTASLQVFLPVDSAAYLLNEKRRELSQLEARLATRVTVVPTTELQSPHFQIKRLRSSEIDTLAKEASHQLKPEIEKEDLAEQISTKPSTIEKPMISLEQMTPSSPPPSVSVATESIVTKPDIDLFSRLWGTLTGSRTSKSAEPDSLAPVAADAGQEDNLDKKPTRPTRAGPRSGNARTRAPSNRERSRKPSPRSSGRSANGKIAPLEQTNVSPINAANATTRSAMGNDSNASLTRRPSPNSRRRTTSNASGRRRSPSPNTRQPSPPTVENEPNGNLK